MHLSVRSPAVLAIGLWWAIAAGTAAQTLVSYDAGRENNPAIAPDPTTQGWTDSGGAAAIVGPLSPDGTTGLNAWFVDDNTSSGTRYYGRTLTPQEHTDAAANGWQLDVVMRLDQVGASGSPMYFTFGDNISVRWLVFVYAVSDGGGGHVYRLKVYEGATSTTLDPGVQVDGQYHTFTLLNQTGSSAAGDTRLLVDGSLVAMVGPRTADTVDGVQWGAGSSSAMGRGHFNRIELTLLQPGSLSMSRVFADHMVLQRGMSIPVWGTAPPSQMISVSFAGQLKITSADGAGNWSVDLEPMTASTNGRPMVVTSGPVTLTFSSVLVGEVWLAAGQSNMRWTVGQSSNSPHPENYPLLRMSNWEGTVGAGGGTVYGPPEFADLTPENFYTGTWEPLDASNVGAQSAVAYFFANAIARELRGTGLGGSDIPVGVVELAYGGTSTEAFIPASVLQADPYLKAAFEDPRGVRTLGQWTTGRITKNLTGYSHADPALPHPHPLAPGFLYHVGMTHIVPFAFKGVIWYQGESNAEFTTASYQWNGDRLSDYQTMVMSNLVQSWRDAFARPDLPFYMVQLPRISASNRVLWPWYREAQGRVARQFDGVELAVVPEFGIDGSNVHPPDKEPVGERLGLIARRNLYGESVVDSGPRYTGQVISNSTIVLRFDDVNAGLVSNDGQPLRHFEIAGEDRDFVAATAVIVGDTVEVSAPGVTEPAAVRYGWDMNLDVNFFNADGLPASPFRTDDWMAAPGRVIRVACIGDSITYGATIPNRTVDSYPAQLQKILGTQNFEVRNFGKSGAGVHRASNKYDNSAEHADALAYNPDIVICNLGINDITDWGLFTRDAFIREYRDLVDAYASLATDPVFIHWHKLAPLFPGQPFYGDPNLVTLNQWIADSAGVTGAQTVDMYEHFKDHPEWFPDNIHPNADGAREVAEETFRFLAGLDPMHGKPRITEFMAANAATLQDEDLEYSDWIEVSNLGRTGMVIGEHHLTDNAGDPTLWQIPAGLILETNESVVIFASGKDRTNLTGQLHTSFTLDENGSYLALTDPDGAVLQEFSPRFPPQFPDTSYGIAEGQTYALVTDSSALRAWVPTSGALGTTWTAVGFDDAGWAVGVQAVGYEALSLAPSGSKDSETFPARFDGDEIWNSTFQNGWSELNGSGTSESLGGSVLRYDHSGSSAASTLDGTACTPDGGATTWNTANHGDWTYEIRLKCVAVPNGFRLWSCTDTHRILVDLYPDRVENYAGTLNVAVDNIDGQFHTFRVAHDGVANVYHVWRDGMLLTPPGGLANDQTGSDSRFLFGDPTSGSFGDNYIVEIAYIRFDQTGIYPPLPVRLYDTLIATDMTAGMTNQNTSCYVRYPFVVSAEELASLDSLALQLQYDDGVVAYLNGVEASRQNAAATVQWDSTATVDRNDLLGLRAESVNVTGSLGSLVPGTNVLAVHGLNHASDATRFLALPALTGAQASEASFLESPTPGAVNTAPQSAHHAWLDTHFSPAEQALPGVSGDHGDPDGDTIVNLFEYLYGMDPRTFDIASPLWMRVEPYLVGEQMEWLLTATYPVRLGLEDVGHEVELTGDLAAGEWNPGAGPHTVLVGDTVNNGDGTQTLTYRDVDAGAVALHRSMRLAVYGM